MLRGEFPEADELTSAELRRAYESRLSAVVDERGVETVAAEAGIDEETVAALEDGSAPELTLADAAAILALEEDRPDADVLAAEARDVLLMGMTTAVLDVERLASGLDGAMEPKEIQGKLEGRHPMTLEEYALIHRFVEERSA